LKLAYRIGLQAVPFEQFDLVFNRPDVVLRAFGFAPRERITAAEHAYEARRADSRAPTGGQRSAAESLPTVTSRPAALSTAQAEMDVRIEATSSVGLERLHVFDNEAPVVEVDGRALSGAASELTVSVPLSAGINEISISVRDVHGVESIRQVSRIMRLGSVESKTYVVAIGVSNYTNPALFLTRAAKDAEDVASAFKTLKGFKGPEPLVLKDENVTTDVVSKISSFVRGATVDDQLVLYIAGHGTNSPKDGYRFLLPSFTSVHDQQYVPFDALEQVLAASMPIRKLLFLDTCFAGGAADVNRPKEGEDEEWRNYDLLDDLVDLRRGSGAVVIAASRGTEVSFDRLPSVDLKHGIFAHAVIESITEAKADTDADGHLRVSELKSYVFDRIEQLSDGLMTPVTRTDNIRNDFTIR
jgi:hypothetical protein